MGQNGHTGPGPGPADLGSRTLQITLGRDTEILLSRLCTHAVETGARPSACTKSQLIDQAVKALAEARGIKLDGPGAGAGK